MILKQNQKVRLHLDVYDSKKNPAKIEGFPNWSSNNDNIIEICVENDPRNVWVIAHKKGSVLISVDVDADLGKGVTRLSSNLDFGVVASSPSMIISSGDPVSIDPSTILNRQLNLTRVIK